MSDMSGRKQGSPVLFCVRIFFLQKLMTDRTSNIVTGFPKRNLNTAQRVKTIHPIALLMEGYLFNLRNYTGPISLS
jgi:hypothetical protein